MEKKAPKTSISEIKKKMRRLTLSKNKEKSFIKEAPSIKEKTKKNKDSKITQRVKVNINIPHSLTQQPSSYLPSQYGNREQTTLLKSINEQLKQKNEPSSVSQTFNIPIKKQVETQTEPKKPKQTYEYSTQTEIPEGNRQINSNFSDSLSDYGTYNMPNSFSDFRNQHSDSSLGSFSSINENNLMEEIQKKVNEKVKSENIKKKDEALSINKLEKLKQKQQTLINEEKIDEDMKQLGDAFKRDELISLIKKIPIIDKPKDTSNLSLLEKVKEGGNESYNMPRQEDYIEIDRGQQQIEDELQGFSPKVTNPLTPPLDTAEESLLEKVKRGIGRPKLTEEERIQRDEQKKNKKEIKKQLISDKAFNVLLSETPEAEKERIRRQYQVDDLTDAEIKAMLKQRYGYTPEQVKRIFSLK